MKKSKEPIAFGIDSEDTVNKPSAAKIKAKAKTKPAKGKPKKPHTF